MSTVEYIILDFPTMGDCESWITPNPLSKVTKEIYNIKCLKHVHNWLELHRHTDQLLETALASKFANEFNLLPVVSQDR